MKRTLALATTALVALVATSFAVAKGLDGHAKSARAVTGDLHRDDRVEGRDPHVHDDGREDARHDEWDIHRYSHR